MKEIDFKEQYNDFANEYKRIKSRNDDEAVKLEKSIKSKGKIQYVACYYMGDEAGVCTTL